MGVSIKEGDDLVGRYAHGNCTANRLPCYLPGHHVWVPGRQAGEELEDGDLKGGGCVCIDPVVCFDDDEAVGRFGGGGRANGVVEACRGVAKGVCVGGQSRGEASRVEATGVRGGQVDKSEIAKVFEHVDLSVGESGFAVILA